MSTATLSAPEADRPDSIHITDLPERIRHRVRVDYVTGCWAWTGPLQQGCGQVKVSGRTLRAHKFVYEALVGPVSDDYALASACGFSHCVRPDHREMRRVRGGVEHDRYGKRDPRVSDSAPGCVYFMERHGFLKIGTTRDVFARMASINRGDSAIPGMRIEPVNLLAVMPGSRHVEQCLHALFADLRYEGEWFLFEDPLVGFVQAVAAAGWAPSDCS